MSRRRYTRRAREIVAIADKLADHILPPEVNARPELRRRMVDAAARMVLAAELGAKRGPA